MCIIEAAAAAAAGVIEVADAGDDGDGGHSASDRRADIFGILHIPLAALFLLIFSTSSFQRRKDRGMLIANSAASATATAASASAVDLQLYYSTTLIYKICSGSV